MGGWTFEHQATGATARAAFDQAVSDARYDHGHAGYTGTIAEKPGFVLAGRMPEGTAVNDLVEVLADWDDDAEGYTVTVYSTEHRTDYLGNTLTVQVPSREWREGPHPALTAFIAQHGQRKADELAAAYNDKWGPALCFDMGVHDGQHHWLFMGWASC